MILIKRMFVGVLAALVLSAGATFTQAQRQPYRGTNRAVRQLILRIENRSDIFRNSLNAQSQNNVNFRNENLENLAVPDVARIVAAVREVAYLD